MKWTRRDQKSALEVNELREIHDALSEVQAVIFFDNDGKILGANKNFCTAMSVKEADIIGQHHRIFVDEETRKSLDYASFWAKLRDGNPFRGEMHRVAGDGRRVTLVASYMPLRDEDGNVYKVVKIASDVTARRSALLDMQTCLEDLAKGNLKVRFPGSDVPEYQELGEQFNSTVARFEKMVQSINSITGVLTQEAQEIATNANNLADRAESQAATLEETTAALEELSSAVEGTASNAQQATEAAQTASQNANNGRQIVSDAIAAMQEIQHGSSEISKIIEVIDGISFQTNLLALNAGIEAARAGDAGRGFAVVASEIRALAQRTAEAAKDISDLIVTSNTSVSSGAQLVDQTGGALDQIGEGMNEVVTNIAEISSATREQADGIGSVTEATSQIDARTQQDAALADESAKSAGKLTASTARLQELVDAFQFGRVAAAQSTVVEGVQFRRSA